MPTLYRTNPKWGRRISQKETGPAARSCRSRRCRRASSSGRGGLEELGGGHPGDREGLGLLAGAFVSGFQVGDHDDLGPVLVRRGELAGEGLGHDLLEGVLLEDGHHLDALGILPDVGPGGFLLATDVHQRPSGELLVAADGEDLLGTEGDRGVQGQVVGQVRGGDRGELAVAVDQGHAVVADDVVVHLARHDLRRVGGVRPVLHEEVDHPPALQGRVAHGRELDVALLQVGGVGLAEQVDLALTDGAGRGDVVLQGDQQGIVGEDGALEGLDRAVVLGAVHLVRDDRHLAVLIAGVRKARHIGGTARLRHHRVTGEGVAHALEEQREEVGLRGRGHGCSLGFPE